MVHETRLITPIRALVAAEAIVFAFAGLLRAGAPIPLGFTEPPFPPAIVVEGLLAAGFILGAVAVVIRKQWVWSATAAAYLCCAAGVLVGLWAAGRRALGLSTVEG
jgi:hypothetical protein